MALKQSTDRAATLAAWRWAKGPGDAAIPVAEIDGGMSGPTWLFTAGVHGDEYEGPAAIRSAVSALAEKRSRGEKFAGRVVALPVCNAMAYAAGVRLTPEDQGNLNRAFPGDANGKATPRWADWLWREFMLRSDRLVDLHAGGAAFAFAAVAGFYRDEDAPLAAMLGLTMWRAPETPGVLSREFRAHRGPSIGAELGYSGTRDDAMALRIADALVRLAHGERASAPSVVHRNHDICSPWTGEWTASCRLGDRVTAGQRLGVVHAWDGVPRGEVTSNVAGTVIAVRRIVSAKEGDLVVGIGVPE